MSPFGSIPQLSPTDLEVVLLYLKNEVKELYDMLGYVEEFINRVMAMIQNHANVPGFKTWAAGILSQLREEKEKKAQKEKEKKEAHDAELLEARVKVTQMEHILNTALYATGNIPMDEPLRDYLDGVWLKRTIEGAETSVSAADLYKKTILPLKDNGIRNKYQLLEKPFLRALVSHVRGWSTAPDVENIYNNFRNKPEMRSA